MVADRTRATATAELADILFDFMPVVVKHVNQRLEELGLTKTDYWALRTIEGPMQMSELAHCMDFDPSYATVVADRLEMLGLVERQPHPKDRRVKNLVLTAKGRRLKRTIPETLWKSSNTFSSLTDAELDQFARVLLKLDAANQ